MALRFAAAKYAEALKPCPQRFLGGEQSPRAVPAPALDPASGPASTCQAVLSRLATRTEAGEAEAADSLDNTVLPAKARATPLACTRPPACLQ